MTMAALDNLPCETLAHIFLYLGPPDLAQTAIVSRWFSEVSEPIAHSGRHSGQSNRRPSLVRFIQTLIHSRRRTLGTHVRSMTVAWDRSARLDEHAYPESIWRSSIHLFPHFHRLHPAAPPV